MTRRDVTRRDDRCRHSRHRQCRIGGGALKREICTDVEIGGAAVVVVVAGCRVVDNSL